MRRWRNDEASISHLLRAGNKNSMHKVLPDLNLVIGAGKVTCQKQKDRR
jgi:hypothetical protein